MFACFPWIIFAIFPARLAKFRIFTIILFCGMLQTLKNIVNSRTALIMMHMIAWAVFFFFPFIFYRIKILDSAFFIKQIINVAFLACFFYINIFYLIPAFLSNRKFLKYVLAIVCCVFVIVLQQFLVEYLFDTRSPEQLQINSLHHDNYASATKETISHNLQISHVKLFIIPEIIRQALLASLFILLLSGSIKTGQEWFKAEKMRKEMENQQLNAELSLLKSQVNPHFLFNTLNSIYSLAHKKSDLTEKAVMMLADMMRYMMVESLEKEVALVKEIQYLRDYISLQKLRLSRDINIDFKVEGDAEFLSQNIMIAPMIFITFVENAFKHGISYLGNSFIQMLLKIDVQQIDFSVENSFIESLQEKGKESGRGLEITRKRLELLYPGKHQLHWRHDANKYFVRLIIRF